jgi:hypothetical protein
MDIRAEEWDTYQQDLEGWPVRVTCYRISKSYVTQIESSICGSVIARGIAATREDSARQAFETARERLWWTRHSERMVGG